MLISFWLIISLLAHPGVHILVPVTAIPYAMDIHIGLGDTPYTSINASVATQLSDCTTLSGPVTRDTDLERQCQSGASGRYGYVYTQGVSGTNYLNTYEFKIYGDPAVETRMYLLLLFNKTVTFMAWYKS